MSIFSFVSVKLDGDSLSLFIKLINLDGRDPVLYVNIWKINLISLLLGIFHFCNAEQRTVTIYWKTNLRYYADFPYKF